MLKYNDLLVSYYFQPVAIETTGVLCMASPLPPSRAVLQSNSLTFRAAPGNDLGKDFSSRTFFSGSEIRA